MMYQVFFLFFLCIDNLEWMKERKKKMEITNFLFFLLTRWLSFNYIVYIIITSMVSLFYCSLFLRKEREREGEEAKKCISDSKVQLIFIYFVPSFFFLSSYLNIILRVIWFLIIRLNNGQNNKHCLFFSILYICPICMPTWDRQGNKRKIANESMVLDTH